MYKQHENKNECLTVVKAVLTSELTAWLICQTIVLRSLGHFCAVLLTALVALCKLRNDITLDLVLTLTHSGPHDTGIIIGSSPDNTDSQNMTLHDLTTPGVVCH